MSQITNDCSCCGFGFESFSADDIHYHNSTLSILAKINSRTGVFISTHSWDGSPTISNQNQVVHTTANGFLYGYSINRVVGGLPTASSVSKRDMEGAVIWDFYPGIADASVGLSIPPTASGSFNFTSRRSIKAEVFKDDGTVVVAGGRIARVDVGDPDFGLVVLTASVKLIDDAGILLGEFTFAPPDATLIDTSAYPTANVVLYGYDINDLCITSGGNIHLTGKSQLIVYTYTDTGSGSYAVTTHWIDIGRFEMQIDRDGNEIWSDIETLEQTVGGSGDSQKSWGVYCVADEGGNVHVIYSPSYVNLAGSTVATSDNLVLVGFDSSGSEVYSKTTAFGQPSLIVVKDGFLYKTTPSPFNLHKYSGGTFSALEWTRNTVAGLQLDSKGQVYSGGGLRKKFLPDGTLVWTGVEVLATQTPVIPPGRIPQFIS